MGVPVFGVQFECAQVTADGIVVCSGLRKHIAEVIVRLGSCGGNCYCLLQACCGCGQFPQLTIRFPVSL